MQLKPLDLSSERLVLSTYHMWNKPGGFVKHSFGHIKCIERLFFRVPASQVGNNRVPHNMTKYFEPSNKDYTLQQLSNNRYTVR